MACGFCKPHADPRKQRLCHEGKKLHDALREAGVRYITLCGEREPPVGSVEVAREGRVKAREAFNEHTGATI